MKISQAAKYLGPKTQKPEKVKKNILQRKYK